jgi:hypothetical protein
MEKNKSQIELNYLNNKSKEKNDNNKNIKKINQNINKIDQQIKQKEINIEDIIRQMIKEEEAKETLNGTEKNKQKIQFNITELNRALLSFNEKFAKFVEQ